MDKKLENTDKQMPIEMSLEDGNSTEQLRDLLNRKAKEKLQLESLKNLNILKKSRFYYGINGELREHIATYKGYAILIKQEQIKEELDSKNNTMFPTLLTLEDLRKLKKVNGNIIRKLQPNSIHEYEKMALIQGVIFKIDEGI